jgi:endonuclease/exonuclease/phosphatase family metal-dependent hydrolase
MQRPHRIAALAAAVIGLSITPPALQATLPSPEVATTAAAAKKKTTELRVATYNVRTARAVHDDRPWPERSPAVAKEILSRKPGVVMLQELGPGRADGKRVSVRNSLRQTTSLVASLQAQGGGEYKLVRSTAYVAPRTPHGTQGARILYDSSRYSLVSHCPETTGRSAYNVSCAFDLPVLSGGRELPPSAAYAAFRDRRTGKKFYAVSAHLSAGHSDSARKEAQYNRLRSRQAAVVASTINKINKHRYPVVFGGDINSWAGDRGNYAPHRTLISYGYRDTARADKRVNIAYPTVNHWKKTLKRAWDGTGNRLDVVMVKGGRGVERFENKMARVDSARPSDHNMVVADIKL